MKIHAEKNSMFKTVKQVTTGKRLKHQGGYEEN